MLNHDKVDPNVLIWIRDNKLCDQFDELFRVLARYFPGSTIRSVKLDKTANWQRVVCILGDVNCTDFNLRLNTFYRDISSVAPEAYIAFRLIRESRFGEGSEYNTHQR